MNNANPKSRADNQECDAEVLYQKLGDTWYAFSILGDEVFMSPIPEEKIEAIRRENYTPGPNL